jgi:hypothetical protein
MGLMPEIWVTATDCKVDQTNHRRGAVILIFPLTVCIKLEAFAIELLYGVVLEVQQVIGIIMAKGPDDGHVHLARG